MIELADVHKAYWLGEVHIPVLNGVSLSIAAGEFVAIMGPSGSGKSTLLNIIACLDVVDSGSYHLMGIAVESASDDALAHIRNARIGFVFQLFNLIPRINALRNVELPLMYAGIPFPQRRRQALEALRRVGLAERAAHAPARLSGGEQQRVAIARALVTRPDVIVADEPTGSLDTRAGGQIMKLFQELNDAGTTVVMVTHEAHIAACAQRSVYLRDGVIESDQKH